MKVYRYNAKNRTDRSYNNCSSEKNPNQIKFYATNLDYAERYRYIMNEDGDVIYECELQIDELKGVNLFDMNENFLSLKSYKKYIESKISKELNDYTHFMNNAKDSKTRKMWENAIEDLKNRENEIIVFLKNTEFQPLSDFSY